MQTNWIAKTTASTNTISATEEPETMQEKPETTRKHPEIWLRNKPGMSNWSVERLLDWANRKKESRHISIGVQRVVDKILELYGPKKEVEQIPEISEIARMRIGGAEQGAQALHQVSNYYLMHQKDSNDDLDLILKLQNKVFFPSLLV